MSTAEDWVKQVPLPRPLSGSDQWNIFVSYRSADQAWVLNLYDALRGYGHKVFVDQMAPLKDDHLHEHLESALASSQAGILVWSSKSHSSRWIQREYQAMEKMSYQRADFHFVPVCIDSIASPTSEALQAFLSLSEYPDGPSGGELLRLLHAVVGQPLSYEAARIALDFDESSKHATRQIDAAIRDSSSARIKELFAKREASWRITPILGCKAAEGLTQLGAYDDAVAMLMDMRREFPCAIRPKQLHALALLRRTRENGVLESLDDAQQIAAELYKSGERDPETLGIYASIWMERYEHSKNMADLKQSRDLYAEAFSKVKNDYYTGINAAAKSVFLGEKELATQLASEVQKIIGTEPSPGDYWMTATVAEAWLIQKNYVEAARNYEAAVAMARSHVGSHKSTWKQACRLMTKLGSSNEERALINKIFEDLQD